MDDLALLLTDHSLLTWRLNCVIGSLRNLSVIGNRASELFDQVAHQADTLRNELVSHFEFEQTSLFPQMCAVNATWRRQIGRFEGQHDGILKAFEEFRSELTLAQRGYHRYNLMSAALSLEIKFDEHAESESRFFGQYVKTGT
jgi:hypothetical protein